ncbi:hypothetical protein REPUB_Repub18cG0114800 [Reevesia pubescens]
MAIESVLVLENDFCVSTQSHWKKAADALQCSHFDEVCQIVSQFADARTVGIQGTTLMMSQANEGLAIVNGTTVGLAVIAIVCFDANVLALISMILSTLFCEVMHGKLEFTDPFTHEIQHHHGQNESTAIMKFLLDENDYMKKAKLRHKKDPLTKPKQDRRIPVFLEELKTRLEEELPKARTRFGMANRIKKCMTYPVYEFVRIEVGTELLNDEKNVSP